MRRPSLRRQRGVAVVTALLITTLAVTIVTSLFWQQQVQLRMMGNQRLQTQAQWVMRNAIDWARLVLAEDARNSTVDQLGEAWAQPVAGVALDDFISNDRIDGEHGATLSRRIEDAQGRYNLGNLAQRGVVDVKQVAVFARLLTLLQLDPGLAKAVAAAVAAGQSRAPQPPTDDAAADASAAASAASAGATPPADGATPAPAAATPPSALALTDLDALQTVPGCTPDSIAKLRDVVALLPTPTQVNVNTAGAAVLAAVMNTSLVAAGAVLQQRGHAYFRDVGDFQTSAHSALTDSQITVSSNYFLIDNQVSMAHATLRVQALVYRKRTGNTSVKWIRAL